MSIIVVPLDKYDSFPCCCLQFDCSLCLNELVKPVDSLQESRFGCKPDFGVLQISLEREAMIYIAVQADLVGHSHILEYGLGLVALRSRKHAIRFWFRCQPK